MLQHMHMHDVHIGSYDLPNLRQSIWVNSQQHDEIMALISGWGHLNARLVI
jgi:hypothetical protein